MGDEPKISVIIPVYNTEDLLPGCLDSVLAQTYQNLEILVVDDGSTDATGTISDDYSKKDSRVKTIHKTNGGVSSARNKGLDIATDDYISFIDADDFIHPKMHKILINLAARYDADMAVCFTRGTDLRDYEEPEPAQRHYKTLKNKEALLKLYGFDSFDTFGYCPTSVVNKMCRKKVFDNLRFDVNAFRAGDDVISTYMFDKSPVIAVTDERLYYVYHRPGSLTRQNYTDEIYLNLCNTVIKMYTDRLMYFSEKSDDPFYAEIVGKIYNIALYDILSRYLVYTSVEAKILLKAYFKTLLKDAKAGNCLSGKRKALLSAYSISPHLYRIAEKTAGMM